MAHFQLTILNNSPPYDLIVTQVSGYFFKILEQKGAAYYCFA